jgi:hypothetical protein
VSNYNDELLSKAFINYIKDIFSPVSNQRYLIDLFSLRENLNELKEDRILLALPNIVAQNDEYRKFFLDLFVSSIDNII